MPFLPMSPLTLSEDIGYEKEQHPHRQPHPHHHHIDKEKGCIRIDSLSPQVVETVASVRYACMGKAGISVRVIAQIMCVCLSVGDPFCDADGNRWKRSEDRVRGWSLRFRVEISLSLCGSLTLTLCP
jgi:hypothetical protein